MGQDREAFCTVSDPPPTGEKKGDDDDDDDDDRSNGRQTRNISFMIP